MELAKAIEVLSRYWPCVHEAYEVLGFGQSARCEDCNQRFQIDSLPRLQEASKKFEAAIDCLNELLPLPDPTPKTEPVEVKRWVILFKDESTSIGYRTKDQAEEAAIRYHAGNVIGVVESISHYSRPVKRKMKRREELYHVPTCYRQRGLEKEAWPKGTRFFAEWEEDEP